ncbi:MAG: DUF2335 domain-containing protein [Desulfomonile tiedjei]|uniref:DUF2335 domain-containing protein n=1 Tax=Desulfomonile tiedjei TaxID=2358 RepID=A0A9D6UZY5_9BACT|nr:DUF2335 domain-containing protein [Desulfomonile tiedjei]
MKKNEQKRGDNKSLPEAQKSETTLRNSHEAQQQGAVIRAGLIERFKGPIPPPEILAKYDQVLPGAADRILAMAERQAIHRQSLEQTVIKSDKWHSFAGLVLGFVIALIFGVGGIYLLAHGHSTDGLVAMLTPLGIMVGGFLYTDWYRRKERAERSQTEVERPEKQLSLPFG